METRQSKKNDDAPPVEVAQPVADSKDSGSDAPTTSDLVALMQAQNATLNETLQAQNATLSETLSETIRAQGEAFQSQLRSQNETLLTLLNKVTQLDTRVDRLENQNGKHIT